MTDSAGYSDIVFGLFWLLGFQFSPRLTKLGETRFWRIDPKANYGTLNGLARHRVKTVLIAQHLGRLSPGRRLSQDGNRSSFGTRPESATRWPSVYPGGAIGELGRIPKTSHLLNFIADPKYRRHILNQLNRGEGRGKLRQRYREGQEDQLGALGLVVNALIL
jgi:TnpA family transposase